MSFTSFKEKQSREDLETEIRVLENSITDEMPAGDIKVVEKRINKLKGQIELVDSSVAGDVAMATTNLFAECDGTPKCQCQKCKLLRRDPAAEIVQEALNFGNFFGK